jgi:Na+/H+ antiporter NhaD/arsenite permease-like protein
MTEMRHALSHWHIVAAWTIFLASYLVFAVGRLPGTLIDRPAMAVIGAVAMFALGVLSPDSAIASVDFATLVLLFAMMLIVASLHLAGFFDFVSRLVIAHLKPQQLLPGVIFTSGILSAVLVNDVVCLFLAPLLLDICRRMKVDAVPYLLALATAANIGGVATITGNPQNMLIGSSSGIGYRDFLLHLGPIALIGLFLDWALLHWFAVRRHVAEAPEKQSYESADHRQEHPAWALAITLGVLAGFLLGYPPPLVAAAGGALLLIRRTRQPREIYGDVDWSLLVLFLGLFLILGGAKQAGITEELLRWAERLNLRNDAIFATVVVLLSNLVSNVPAVMLLRDLIPHFHDPHTSWLVLATSSTLAGNLTITGSVANIIVIEKARQVTKISFWDYMKIGIPVTLLTLLVGLLWLRLGLY